VASATYAPNPEDRAIAAEQRAIVRTSLARLPQREAEILIMGGSPSLRRRRLMVTETVQVNGSAFSSHTCSRGSSALIATTTVFNRLNVATRQRAGSWS
jgi:hypothetical protein